MQLSSEALSSVWQRLIQRQIDCQTALQLLVTDQGSLNLSLLDEEVSQRFFRHSEDPENLPPVVPLLLWQNCYYLASPTSVDEEQLNTLKNYHRTQVEIIPITSESYQAWQQRFQQDKQTPSSTQGIRQTTSFYLSQADDQTERLQALIESAIESRASDIHLEPMPDGLRIRYRIDGILRQITTLTPSLERPLLISLKVLCGMDISETRIPQDGRISANALSIPGVEAVDLRVSIFPCISDRQGTPAETAVIRLLSQENTFQSIQELGFQKDTQAIYESWLDQPQGIIIFTGPTGSGKTSTLYTSLQKIATESVNVITIEDPVEYILPRVTQTQINEAAGMTFDQGMRAVLRQDPDIILLGEIRDEETAETAIEAALTGHLVLTTLHTNDSVGAIPRLQNLGVLPGLLSDALIGVVAQRLVRRVCPHCAQEYTPTPAELQDLNLETVPPDSHFRRGKGCTQCFQSGYRGREGIFELLDISDSIRQMIYDESFGQEQVAIRVNNPYSFRQAALAKVKQGVTTVEEVQRVLPYRVLQRSKSRVKR